MSTDSTFCKWTKPSTSLCALVSKNKKKRANTFFFSESAVWTTGFMEQYVTILVCGYKTLFIVECVVSVVWIQKVSVS